MPKILNIIQDEPDPEALDITADILFNGGIIIYPTETVYGIGSLYTEKESITRIHALKKRSVHNPFLLLIPETAYLDNLASEIPEEIHILTERFWPGPLTLVFSASATALGNVISPACSTIACRVSSSQFVRELLKRIKQPITSTSANISGGDDPCTVADIPKELLDASDIILDGGTTPGILPSTVFDVSQRPFTIRRQGCISEKLLFDAVAEKSWKTGG